LWAAIHPPPSLSLGEKGGLEAGDFLLHRVKKTILQDRAKGFEDEINSISGMKSVTVGLPADPSDSEAGKYIQKVLDENPDAGLVYTTNLMWGLRFARYFKKNKINKKLITFDCDKEMGEFIETGIVQSAIAQRQFIWGEVAVKWMVDAINGKAVPKYEDTGTYEVNKSNLIVFYKRLT
jgi:ABC-type sugar transport system substrate-binding protein